MKRMVHARYLLCFMLLLTLLTPVTVLAFDDGKKHFTEGMKHEAAEEWDKAAEEFALAVSASPKNPEYRLHLARSLFNASQMFMKLGTIAATDHDYEGGYVDFRRAYAFDPTNELAKSEMERMVRLQKDINEGTSTDKKDQPGKVKIVPTGYPAQTSNAAATQIPQKLEKLRDIPFPSGVDLQFIIKELARDLDLNVLFDSESFRGGVSRKVNIDLRNVTAAKALDYIFLQEGLFFQKVGPHTILVANQTARVKFQQLVLRTFYLANAAPKDVAKIVQTAIPAQPGRSQTIVLTDDATNSITIRDTAENIRLIGKLISSLDKDRAEVVMDVAIYEVNKSDLLQLGNQVGTQSELNGLGGSQPFQVKIGNNPLLGAATATAVAAAIPTVAGIGLLLPSATLNAFQSKNNTRLVASTQIHAFNNEDSSATIGQRVPVQSAQISNGFTGTGTNNGTNGFLSNVINYEQVGLTLKFKPLVFPNQDVQVAMEITSKDVAGAQTLTPTFTERTIKGTARVQNNKTLLLASVAQGVESNGKQGLPLLGLIPIIGRLFTAPTRDNRQVDIVIAVTPRVIRAPAILPEDEVERDTGSVATPTNSSLEAMIIEDERDDMLAAARANANTAVVQIPDKPVDSPSYVKTGTVSNNTDSQAAPAPTQTVVAKAEDTPGPVLKPIENGIKTLQLKETADVVTPPETTDVKASAPEPTAEPERQTIALNFGSELAPMKAGEKVKIPVMIQGTGTFSTVTMGIQFDDKKLAVRGVSFGDVFGGASNTAATPFLNQNGKMYVTMTAPDHKDLSSTGTLAFIEVEALADGSPQIAFDHDLLFFQSTDGKNLAVKVKE